MIIVYVCVYILSYVKVLKKEMKDFQWKGVEDEERSHLISFKKKISDKHGKV